MTITSGDVYRSGPWLQSLDFVGGGLPSYAVVRTVIRFAEQQATFREVIEVDHRAEFEQTTWDRVVTYSGKNTYVTIASDRCTLTGHLPAPNLLVFIYATELGTPDADSRAPNYLRRFDGWVFEKVTDSAPL